MYSLLPCHAAAHTCWHVCGEALWRHTQARVSCCHQVVHGTLMLYQLPICTTEPEHQTIVCSKNFAKPESLLSGGGNGQPPVGGQPVEEEEEPDEEQVPFW